MKKVDYKTLLFFVGLFVVVSGLEETGVLEILAGFIGSVSGGNIAVMIAIIIIVSAVASAFIDNIPFAATMIPVITDLASDVAGVNLTVLAWALAIGTDIGGSATPIGASANVVGIATAAKVLQIYGSCYYNSSSNISGDDLRQIFMMPGSRMTSFGFNIIPIKGG